MLDAPQIHHSYHEEDGIQEESSDEQRALPLSRFTCVIIYVACVMTIMFFVTCKQGDISNKCFKHLANNVQGARWRSRTHCSKDWEWDDELLALSVERLAIMSEATPVSIAGVELSLDLGY